MKLDIVASPLIDTMLNEEYRVFVQQPFDVDVFINSFYGWKTYSEESIYTGAKFSNIYDKSTIEFFGGKSPYKITNPKLVGDKTFLFPFPNNLDNFICDCTRCFVDLHWNDEVLRIYDRKHLLKQSELPQFFENLLIKLEKT